VRMDPQLSVGAQDSFYALFDSCTTFHYVFLFS
jgi:hypothetical protein